jgi:hypothetical protein
VSSGARHEALPAGRCAGASSPVGFQQRLSVEAGHDWGVARRVGQGSDPGAQVGVERRQQID